MFFSCYSTEAHIVQNMGATEKTSSADQATPMSVVVADDTSPSGDGSVPKSDSKAGAVKEKDYKEKPTGYVASVGTLAGSMPALVGT